MEDTEPLLEGPEETPKSPELSPKSAPPPTAHPPPPEHPGKSWRNGAAFWLLGLFNNLPYVLMLSAARDILHPPQAVGLPPNNASNYDCSPISTGAVLLADILPTLLIKLLAPFFVHLLPYHVRAVAAALGAWGGLSGVLGSRGAAEGLGGVLLGSAASGLGEVTFLGLAATYGGSSLPSWASGSGGAGPLGAGLWGVGQQAGLPLPHALLPALLIPMGTLLSFFFLLGPPPPLPHPAPPLSSREKWGVAKAVLPRALPLGVVYCAEYCTNQGLLDLLYFPTPLLTHTQQYSWFQFLYQFGVFLARSSPFRFRRLGAFALVQLSLLGIFLGVVLAPPPPPGPGVGVALGVAMALVLGEGLVGGGAYANSVISVGEEAPPGSRALSMALVALPPALGTALAGGAAMGLHGLLCPTETPPDP